MSSVQDRSREFFHTVSSIRDRKGLMASTPLLEGERPEKTQVHTTARNIAAEIDRTARAITDLKGLTRSGPFSDNPAEVERLTDVAKGKVSNLTKAIKSLSSHIAQKKSQYGPNAYKHHASVVVILQTRLKEETTRLNNILESRTKALKEKRERMKKYNGPRLNGNVEGMEALVSAVDYPDDGESGGHDAIDMSGMQLQHYMPQEDTYVSQRASAMQRVESTIAELAAVFKQLAELVQMQGEQLERIDTHVQETSINVSAAHEELLKFSSKVSSNRALMFKVFGVLILFIILFVVFLA